MISPDYITHQEIRLLAHELWKRAGCPENSAEQFWLAAEEQLRRERDELVATAAE